MPITPLPDDACRRIGSTLNITSTFMVLKELLDNALDSGAQTIHISVSPNTVDKIEVRDNGSGISSFDFNALGRPSHTSKLSSFEDIDKIGGKSLGFRGTALASINTVATVHVITRVGLETPQMIRLADNGGVETQSVHAADQGTTVTVTNIFSNYPVRERIARKPVEISKNIEKMRHLVQAYAFARHPLRIHFAVLQNPNQSLRISPHPGKDIRETAIQIFGVQKASQCFVRTWPDRPDLNTGLPGEERSRRHVFEAILMKPDAEHSKIPKGLFFSVDSRPISATRGTGRKLTMALKECLRQSVCPLTSAGVPKDIFICLNICCSLGWYDVNIEPAKEDVLFLQEDQLISDFKKFLRVVYPSIVDEGQGCENRGEVLEACSHLEDGIGRQGNHRPDEPNSTSIADQHKKHAAAALPLLHSSRIRGDGDGEMSPQNNDNHRDLFTVSTNVTLQNYLHSPTFHKGQASSWTVDMSAPVDGSDGDFDMESQNELGQPVCPTVEEESNTDTQSQEESRQRSESHVADGHNALAELNPWSIAAMGSLKRRPLPSGCPDNQQFHEKQPTLSRVPPRAEATGIRGPAQSHQRGLPIVRLNPSFKLPVTPLTPSPSSEPDQLMPPSLRPSHGNTSHPTYKDRLLPRRIYPHVSRAARLLIGGSSDNAAQRLEVPLGETPISSNAVQRTSSLPLHIPKRQQNQQRNRVTRGVSAENVLSSTGDPNQHSSSDSDDATTELHSSENTDSEDETAVSGLTNPGAWQHRNGGDIRKHFEKRYPDMRRADGHSKQATLPFEKHRNNVEGDSDGLVRPTAGSAIRSQHNARAVVTETSASGHSNNPLAQSNHEDAGEAAGLQSLFGPKDEQRVGHALHRGGKEQSAARIRRPHFRVSNHDTDRPVHSTTEVGLGQNTRSWLPLGTPKYETHAPRVIINTLELTVFRPIRELRSGAENHPRMVSQSLRLPFSEWDRAILTQLKKLLRKLAPATEWTLHPNTAEDCTEMERIGRQWAKERRLELQS